LDVIDYYNSLLLDPQFDSYKLGAGEAKVMECTLHRVFWKSLDPLKEGFTTKEDAIGHLKKFHSAYLFGRVSRI
jgi:hypothetical protein